MSAVVGQAPVTVARPSTTPKDDKTIETNSKADKTKAVSTELFNNLRQ
jgi:hypothetical protein